jgi:type IV pilus assembly protein PilQ
MRTHTLLTALLAASLLPAGWAQTPPAAPGEASPATPAASTPVIIEDAAPGGATRQENQDTLSVDFPDEDVRTILRNVADLFELNLVVPDTLQGKTSIKLRDVTWRQIFQVVLSPVGYTYVEEGNIITVVSQDQLLMEPVITEVFLINYARASDILTTINPLVDGTKGGRVVVDARSNALVITERPSQMTRIRPIIEQLDKATAQVMIESKFVEVTDRDVKNIGVNWASLQGFQIGAGEMSQQWNRLRGQERVNGSDSSSTTGSNSGSSTTNTTTTTLPSTSTTSTTITGSQLVQQTTTTIDPITLQPVQTTSFTTIPTNSSNTSTVTNSGGTAGSTAASSTSGNTASSAINNLLGLVNTAGTSREATAVFSASDFNVVLSALQTQNNIKLVSNPTIVTLNNTEANINIGEEFPIPNYTYNQERGTFEVSGFDYRPIGILLKVTPQVNSQGFIKLSVEPEVSSRAGVTSFGGAGGAEIPIIATRKTKTQVSLKDGYTMGIGGLIENTSQNGQTKVPVLGNIPGLGRLFRSDTKNVDSRNLLIFITAKTINPEGAPIEEVFDPRSVRAMGLKRDELPGYRDGSDPFAPAPGSN